MKRRRVILIAVACVAAVVVAFLVWPGEREPEFQGRKLSEWVETLNEDSAPNARSAIRQIGTNALPCFVRWISYSPSKPKTTSLLFVSKVPAWLGGDQLYRLVEGGRESRASEAEFGLVALGPVAAPVVPELTALMRHTNESIRLRAIEILGWIGQPGIPALVAGLNDDKYPERSRAADRLIRAYRDAADTNSLTAVIRQCLRDSDPDVVCSAVGVLPPRVLPRGDAPEGSRRGKYKRFDCDFAVPVLTELTKHSYPRVRYEAVSALGKYRQEARPAVDALVCALGDSDWLVRLSATNALERVAPERLPMDKVNAVRSPPMPLR